MSAKRRISEGKLAEFWRVHVHTLRGWRLQGRLPSDVKEEAENGYHHYYYISTIEAYHAAHSAGFGPERPIPSFARLRQSDPALLLAEEAATCLGCSVDRVLANALRGVLPAFYLGEHRSLRLPAALVSLQASSKEGAVKVNDAARILCIKPSGVRRLLYSGRLKPLKLVGDIAVYVERNSLLELLATQISPFIPPEVWWEKTLQDPSMPLPKARLAAEHHVHKRTLDNLITANSKSLPYIRTTGKTPQTLIPAWGVRRFLREEREQLTPQELSAILGEEPERTLRWQQAHSLCKRHHGQAWHRCPTLSCMREYITTRRTHATLDADSWLTNTLRLGVAAISSDTLISTTPILEYRDIKQALDEGIFTGGVWLPSNGGAPNVALPRPEAISFRRRWER